MFKENKKIKIIALILCLTFIFMSFPFDVTATNAELNQSSALTAELKQLLATKSNNDFIDVTIWHNSIDIDTVEQQLIIKLGYGKANLNNTANMAIVQNYIAEKRKAMCILYQKLNKAFADDLASKEKESEIIFASKYAPMQIVKTTKTAIVELARQNESIQTIDVHKESIITPMSDISNANSGATYLRDTTSISATGDGVKIGMIETGLPNINKGYFNNSNLHLTYEYNHTSDYESIAHATLVAAIMVGKGTSFGGKFYKGIAPDAELYYGTAINEYDYYRLVEDFIDKGVNIINFSNGISYGFDSATASYNIVSQWTDHIAFQHDVHFVAAAGFGELVEIPANAYNVISVGCFDDSNIAQQPNVYAPINVNFASMLLQNTEMCYYSPFITRYNEHHYKPDVVASGYGIEYADIYTLEGESDPYTNLGTSFATPQVSGYIAQLCELYPYLLTNNSGIKAILTTSAMFLTGDTLATDIRDNSFMYLYQGSGIANVRCAYQILLGGKVQDKTLSQGTNTYSFTINVPESYDYIRLGVSWIKKNSVTSPSNHISQNPTVNNAQLANYKLEVFYGTNTSQTPIVSSNSAGTNLEIVHFNVTQYGTYTVKVTLLNPDECSGSQYLSFAWY